MGAWAYCDNAGCSHEFDKPSFAEILARKRECPVCGAINYVSDDLGTALDEAFKDITELATTKSQLVRVEKPLHGSRPAAVIIDDLPGMWEPSDLSGGETDCNVAAGQEANTAPKFVGTLLYQIGDVAAIRLTNGTTLPPGYYTVLLTKED